jgi:hypothetical protein
MGKPLLIENFDAGAAILPRRFVGPGASDGLVIQAAAATSKIMGVSDDMGADAAGDRVDIVTVGTGEIELGGTVAAGDQLTSDSVGRGVVAVAGNRTGGVARVSGVVGDIIDYSISPGTV